jgi:hypothetical protein
MDAVPRIGRIFFAAAIALLGIQQIIRADFVQGPLVAPAWLPLRMLWAVLSGLALAAGAVGIAVAPRGWPARRRSSWRSCSAWSSSSSICRRPG